MCYTIQLVVIELVTLFADSMTPLYAASILSGRNDDTRFNKQHIFPLQTESLVSQPALSYTSLSNYNTKQACCENNPSHLKPQTCQEYRNLIFKFSELVTQPAHIAEGMFQGIAIYFRAFAVNTLAIPFTSHK